MPNVSSQGKAHLAPGSYIQISDPAGAFSDELFFSGRLKGTYSYEEPSGVTEITNSESPQDDYGIIQPEFIENKIAGQKVLTITVHHAPDQTLPLGKLKDVRINWAKRRTESVGAIWNFQAVFSNLSSTGAFTQNQAGETTVQMTITGKVTKTAPIPA